MRSSSMPALFHRRRPAASRLTSSSREIASGEDYFPFRAQWLSADEFLYPADGKIKKRSISTGRILASTGRCTSTATAWLGIVLLAASAAWFLRRRT